MITRDNIREVFDLVTKDQIDRVMNSKNDYILLELVSYGAVYLMPVENSESAHEEALESGGVCCDKDDLLRLFKESGSKNPFFAEYL